MAECITRGKKYENRQSMITLREAKTLIAVNLKCIDGTLLKFMNLEF